MIVVTVGASVLGVAGTAEAYFKAAAGGTGNASGGSVSLLTNGTPTVSATKLYPGGPATSLNFDVVNPNSRPVSITGGTLGTITGCTDVTVAGVNPFPLTVGANSDVTFSGTIALKSTASNGCQGQTITVPLTLTGKLS